MFPSVLTWFFLTYGRGCGGKDLICVLVTNSVWVFFFPLSQ